jgi:hypothetical protein
LRFDVAPPFGTLFLKADLQDFEPVGTGRDLNLDAITDFLSDEALGQRAAA